MTKQRIARRDYANDYKQVNFRISPELKERFTAECSRAGLSISAMLEALITEWVELQEAELMPDV